MVDPPDRLDPHRAAGRDLSSRSDHGAIDLHCHTTASDGALAPAEVVRLAHAAGVGVLAITDHDTVAAVEEAAVEARPLGVRIVPGVEISARLGDKEIHVLGHFVDPSDARLLSSLADFGHKRRERAERMVEQLRAHGAPLPLEEVLEGEGSVGRPHLARLLVAHGHARDFREAFDRWLGKGKPGWVDRPMPAAEDAIALIRGAGGAASLAHPRLSRVSGEELVSLARAGLSGVEVDHPRQDGDARRILRLAAGSLGLEATAGSDFHEAPDAPGLESMDAEAFRRYETAAGKDRV